MDKFLNSSAHSLESVISTDLASLHSLIQQNSQNIDRQLEELQEILKQVKSHE